MTTASITTRARTCDCEIAGDLDYRCNPCRLAHYEKIQDLIKTEFASQLSCFEQYSGYEVTTSEAVEIGISSSVRASKLVGKELVVFMHEELVQIVRDYLGGGFFMISFKRFCGSTPLFRKPLVSTAFLKGVVHDEGCGGLRLHVISGIQWTDGAGAALAVPTIKSGGGDAKAKLNGPSLVILQFPVHIQIKLPFRTSLR